MLNVYNVYAISPRKYPAVNVQGARAFMDFMTSQAFQTALARFPSAQRPGFFPAAFPRVDARAAAAAQRLGAAAS